MALSKRFASITVPGVPQDDDDAYDDEILQRLLKKPTNFSQIEPSKLGFSSHRDVLGTEGVSDDELEEDWANDFKSLLKSCESNKAVAGEEDIEAKVTTEGGELNDKDDDIKHSFISKDEKPTFSSSEFAGELTEEDHICLEKKKHTPVIEDQVACCKNASVKGRLDRASNETRSDFEKIETTVCNTDKKKIENIKKKIENITVENVPNKDEKSDAKTSQVPSNLETETIKREKDCVHEKVKGNQACDNKVQQNRKVLQTVERKNNFDADSALKLDAKPKCEKSKDRHKNKKSETSDSLKQETSSHDKVQNKPAEGNERRNHDKSTAIKHKLTKANPDILGKTIQSDERTAHQESSKEQKNRGAAVTDRREIPAKSRNNESETKKNRPLVIKEATSFPLDDLLPAAAPIKKPRTSLDSNISRSQESPGSARKRHKSERISSHQISAKKQKVDVEPRLRIDEVDFDRNESGNISYIPEDVASLLAAVDTNQSLLNFFRQKLHKETGSKMLSGNLYDDPVAKPAGFYTERNEDLNLSSVSIDVDNNKSSEELFHLLVQQCSELVKTEEDRSKLQSLVNLLKAESGSDFANTGFTPELEDNNRKSPPPPSPDRKSPPSPYSPKSKQNAAQTFEGRTLLKGGVEPRHIPKNFLTKLGKSRPIDPRTYSASKEFLVLPLPKFAEEFWKKEKVRQLRKKNLAIKDGFKSKHDKMTKMLKVGHNQDPHLAKVEHQTKHNSDESQPTHKLDENQNLLTDDAVETSITGVSALKGIRDPGFYAAVVSVFSGDDEKIQPKNKMKLSSDLEIDGRFEIKHANTIPVLISGMEIVNHDPEDRKIPVVTGHNAVTANHLEPVHMSNLVHIETTKNILPSSSAVSLKPGSQTGPCIGIVKPMQIQNDNKTDPGHSDNADMRQVNMELFSDTEDGEINDITEDKAPERRDSKGIMKQSKRRNGQEKEKRIFGRIRQDDRRDTDDDSSSCSSASSRGRHHKRSWRGGHYDYTTERNRRSRSRYSSCSSVDSRISDRSYDDRKRYHSQRGDSGHAYRPYHNDRRFQRGNRGRNDNKTKFFERKSHFGKSAYCGKSEFDRRHVERYNRESLHSGNVENRKVVVDEKRQIKAGTQRIEKEPLSESRNVKRRHSIEITDSEDEKLSMDYRQKFGNKQSPRENSDSCTIATAVSQSKPLPESYNADREFLNYSLKKMKMADKVKHDYAAGSVSEKLQDKQEENPKRVKSILKNWKEINYVKTDIKREELGKQSKSIHDRIGVKPQVSVKQTKSVQDRIGVKPQTKSVHDRRGVKPQASINRPQAAADGTGVFKYSDMISLADLEQLDSESFTFKKKK